LDRLDLVLVMTVNPGFGGQSFIAPMIDKIAAVRKMLGSREVIIEVDGGITAETAGAVAAAVRVRLSPGQLFSGDQHMTQISLPSAIPPLMVAARAG
jgi:ribulose-phosphate 3-epimerase